MSWLHRPFRILCIIALAMMTASHVCDATTERVVGLVSVAASSGDKAPSADKIVVEKCHTCAVVSLPAVLAVEDYTTVVRWIPSTSVATLTSFTEPAIGPPPRA
jgi:hypothetical protein